MLKILDILSLRFQIIGPSDNTEPTFSHVNSRLELSRHCPCRPCTRFPLTQPHVAYNTPLLLLSPSCTWAVVPAKGSESPWKFLRKLKKTPWGESRGWLRAIQLSSAFLSVHYVPGTVLSTAEPGMNKKSLLSQGRPGIWRSIKWLIQKFRHQQGLRIDMRTEMKVWMQNRCWRNFCDKLAIGDKEGRMWTGTLFRWLYWRDGVSNSIGLLRVQWRSKAGCERRKPRPLRTLRTKEPKELSPRRD